LVVGVLVNNLFWRNALRLADNFYQQLDAIAPDDGTPQPSGFAQTGNPQSLIAWNTIGRDSRIYIQSGPDATEIARITGRPAMEPLRTYVGLRAAATVEERAELALAEMQRIGAFDRSVLVLVMPVGPGWVDRAALDTLE